MKGIKGGTQVIPDMDPIRCRRLIKSKLLFAKQQNLRLSAATCQRNFQKVVEKLLSTHLKIPPEGKAKEEEEGGRRARNERITNNMGEVQGNNSSSRRCRSRMFLTSGKCYLMCSIRSF